MCMLKLSYLIAIVPIAVLLTTSFFVLFTLRKIEEKGLRAFGYVVLIFLWLAALVVFSGAVYKTAQGSSMRGLMQQKMRMACMSQMMQKDNPMSMVEPEKGPVVRNEKMAEMSKCKMNKGVISKTE